MDILALCAFSQVCAIGWDMQDFANALHTAAALIAHLAVGDPMAAWIWSVATFVLEALSYYFYRRLARAA